MKAELRIYKARDGYRWRAVAMNGRVVADSGESYRKARGALAAARRLLTVEWETLVYLGEVVPLVDSKEK